MYRVVRGNGTAGQKAPVCGHKCTVPRGTASPTGPGQKAPVGAVPYRGVPLVRGVVRLWFYAIWQHEEIGRVPPNFADTR